MDLRVLCASLRARAVYKFLLTFRYLRRKLIPIFALKAVTLCTAMVIIVLSIMGVPVFNYVLGVSEAVLPWIIFV